MGRHGNRFTAYVTGKTQADGVFTIDTGPTQVYKQDILWHYQVQIVVPDTTTAGTLQLAIKSPDAAEYTDLVDVIDLVNGPLSVTFDAVAESLQFTPSSFQAEGGDYDVNVTAWR